MKEINDGVISYEKLILNGPVVETYRNRETSIYKDVYINAANLVEEIVDNNHNSQISIKNGFEYEGSNVISFIGRRGVGKTSAMFSFSNILTEYTKADAYAEVKNFFENRESMKNVAFYTLDHIDASVMEESEDVFILVLANMFSKALAFGKNDSGRMREYDNRQLFQKFEEVYNNFMALNTKIKEYDEYAAFEKLEQVGGGQRIRKNFAELVQIFLKMIDNSEVLNQDTREGYLVIIIDDLDMAVHRREDGSFNWGVYKIMSTIYKYLMVPHVIILTAYDHEKLAEECTGYYYDQKYGKDKGKYYAGTEDDKIARDSTQFMEKIFPIFSRLYMPSWRKRDLQDENGIRIELRNSDSICKELGLTDSGEYTLSVKDFILNLLAKRTKIYFDIEGRKKHFFEPDTLRTLYNYTQFIIHLNPCKADNKKEFLPVFKHNIRKLKEDCYFRFKEEQLTNTEEHQMFNKWLEEPFERRGPEIVKTICRDIWKLGKTYKIEYDKSVQKAKQGEENLEELHTDMAEKNDNRNTEYSYAELVHGIYHMTRDKKEEYSRELVFCILYSYTLHLTEIYTKYKWYKSQISKKDYISYYRKARGKNKYLRKIGPKDILAKIDGYYKSMKEMIGPTVCGKWSEYYFPEVFFSVERIPSLGPRFYGPYIMGYMENIRTQPNVFSDENAAFSVKNIKSFLFAAMMYADALAWTKESIVWEHVVELADGNEKVGQDIRDNQESNKVFYFSIKSNKERVLDMTGFFKYTFCYAEFLGKMEAILIEALPKRNDSASRSLYDGIPDEEQEHVISSIVGSIRRAFGDIWEEYYRWDQRYGNMMLPLYSLDITYNVIKRVFLECKQENMGTVWVSDYKKESLVYELYSGMFRKFREHMHRLDIGYHQEEADVNFENAFVQCPVYQFIESYNDQEKDWSSDILQQYLGNMVRSFALDQGYMTGPEG